MTSCPVAVTVVPVIAAGVEAPNVPLSAPPVELSVVNEPAVGEALPITRVNRPPLMSMVETVPISVQVPVSDPPPVTVRPTMPATALVSLIVTPLFWSLPSRPLALITAWWVVTVRQAAPPLAR